MIEEEYLHLQLRILQEEYQKACEPIVRRLVAIENMRAPRIMVTAQQLQHL